MEKKFKIEYFIQTNFICHIKLCLVLWLTIKVWLSQEKYSIFTKRIKFLCLFVFVSLILTYLPKILVLIIMIKMYVYVIIFIYCEYKTPKLVTISILTFYAVNLCQFKYHRMFVNGLEWVGLFLLIHFKL